MTDIEVQNILNSPEGLTFQSAFRKALDQIKTPELLVRVSKWPVVSSFKNDIIKKLGRPLYTGELKQVLWACEGVTVFGPKKREVIRLSESMARAPLQFEEGADAAKSWSRSKIPPFREWVASDKLASRELQRLKDQMREHPLPSGQINESEVWNRWAKFAKLNGQTSGPLKEAFESVGCEGRVGYYGLPNMPDSYWPVPNVMLFDFTGSVVSKKAAANGTSFIVALQDCCDEEGGAVDGLNSDSHILSAKIASEIETGRVVYGKYRKTDEGVSIASLSHEPPLIKKPDAVQCSYGGEGELDFLGRFKRYAQQAGFVYADRDLIRFHTGVKIGLITVLTGAPGTGKSSLVKLYARALAGVAAKADGDKKFLRVFVNPTWNQPADFVGEMDPIRDPKDSKYKFKPAGNGVYERLVDAQRDTVGRLFTICLEEMNLSPVEYYFSDFIQIVDDRTVAIPNVSCLQDENPRENPLMLGENVCLFGTCNTDSSTHPLSPRFLDRCNCVTLFPRKEIEGLSSVNRASVDKIIPAESEDGQDYPVLTKKLRKEWLKTADEQLDDWGDADATLDSAYARIRAALENLGVTPSNRAENHIKLYILNRPGKAASVKEFQLQALDEAIAQMVLPKCRLNAGLMQALDDAKMEMKSVFGEESLSFDYLEELEKQYKRAMDW